MPKSLAEQIGNWCRHFNGIDRGTCKAGVRYEDVRGSVASKTYPCFKENGCAERCASASFLSEQEIAEEVKRSEEAAARFIAELTEGVTCPHCHKPITELYQVGRCVYNRGCRCRQYQGVVPKDKRTRGDQKQIDEASLWSPLEGEES